MVDKKEIRSAQKIEPCLGNKRHSAVICFSE